MREFLEYVTGQLVDQPGELILRDEVRGDTHHYLLSLPASEVGKIIGKQGHTIRAIRNLMAAATDRHGQRCTFEIVEPASPSAE